MADEIEHRTEERVPGKGMSFPHFVATIADGALAHELTGDLREVAAALNQHFQDFRGAPKAEITLKLKFKLEKGVVHVLADKSVKLPKPPEAGALLYVDAANNFTQENPNQMHMGFPRSGPRAVT